MRKIFGLITGNPLIAGAIGLGAVLLVLAVVLFFRNAEKKEIRAEDTLRNQGATTERLETSEEILNAVHNAQRPVGADELERMRDKYDRNRPASS